MCVFALHHTFEDIQYVTRFDNDYANQHNLSYVSTQVRVAEDGSEDRRTPEVRIWQAARMPATKQRMAPRTVEPNDQESLPLSDFVAYTTKPINMKIADIMKLMMTTAMTAVFAFNLV